MRRKDTAVMDAIASIKDNNEVVEVEEVEATPQPAVLSEKEILLNDERAKCEGMSRDELINHALTAKENLWSSHDQRDELERFIRERDEKIVKYEKKIRDLEAQISNSNKESATEHAKSEREKKDLSSKLTEANGRIKKLEAEAGKIGPLKDKITDLEEALLNKENAAKNTQLNLERANKAEIDKLNEGHEAKLDKCKERIKKLESDLKEVKADNKKLKADLEKAQDKADSFEESYGQARDANFAGMIVRDIPREMDLQFESVDEQVKDLFEALMADVRGRYLSVANGVIKAADDKISNQETAADNLEKAKKKYEDHRSQSEIADRLKEEAEREYEAAMQSFNEAKGEA